MGAVKVAITIEEELLERIDGLVQRRKFPSRSRAIQEAVRDKLDRLDRGRLARECTKLDRASEQKMADGSGDGLRGMARVLRGNVVSVDLNPVVGDERRAKAALWS
jgi:Arc/MetJ-type ribon-helix-helix transcriptional regulator